MKKIFLALPLLALVFTACDPSKDSVDMPDLTGLTGEQLAAGFTVTQYSDDTYTTEAPDGNYFKFSTSPSRVVTVYQLDEDGNQNVLASGKPNGTFSIIPKRGNPEEQTYYVDTYEWDGTKITATKTCSVYVPSELSPAMRILASDAYGYKVWKWDTEFREDGAVWGNVGYAAGDYSQWTSGIWWGATPEGLLTQVQHSANPEGYVPTGEESADAYMQFYDDGTLIVFDAGGNQIRKGKFSVEGYDGSAHSSAGDLQAEWSFGDFVTSEGAIMWPYQINNHDEEGGHDTTLFPTRFEIVKIDGSHLQLVYPQQGIGSWGEATWWAFKSNSDPEIYLSNYGTKDWTWDTEFREDGAVWGNAGYGAGDNSGWTSGIWWGATPDGLLTQGQHAVEKPGDAYVATGEEDANAYMTFDWSKGTVTSYNVDGQALRSTKYAVTKWNMGGFMPSVGVDGNGAPLQESWSLGIFHTDADGILWPYQINNHDEEGGHDTTRCPTDFEILKLDENHFQLIYPQQGIGSWGEATWWAFKAK